jgi:uncharacterized protein (DUF58 family)
VIIFGVGFAALNTGNNLLYLVLSLMLAFLALSGVLSETALRGIRVQRRLPRELYAGAQNPVQLEISNDQRHIPAFAIVVEDRLWRTSDGDAQIAREAGGAPRQARRRRTKTRRRRKEGTELAGRCFALRIGAGEREVRRYVLEPHRRGPMAFHSFLVSTRFPFGLFRKSRLIDASEQTLVYPEIADLRRTKPQLSGGDSGRTALSDTGAGGSVTGLREFREGDSQRHIHWATSLRRAALLVCETEDDRDAEVEVRLRGVDGHDDRADERFEKGVSRTASEVVRHLCDGLAVGLGTDALVLPPESGPRQQALLLAFLARVGRYGRVAGEASR